MSKYQPLWEFVKETNQQKLILSFDEIQSILGFPIDHSFLSFKKELLDFGYFVGKISQKNKTIEFGKDEKNK